MLKVNILKLADNLIQLIWTLTVLYTHMMQNVPSKLKPPGPPKNALKMLLASKSGKGHKEHN